MFFSVNPDDDVNHSTNTNLLHFLLLEHGIRPLSTTEINWQKEEQCSHEQ